MSRFHEDTPVCGVVTDVGSVCERRVIDGGPCHMHRPGAKRAAPRKTRYWQPGDPRPLGEPRRYVQPSGYVVLRWNVPGGVIDAREHVWIAGEPGKVVHHLNHDRSDNRPENLVALTPDEHVQLHAAERRADEERIIELHDTGLNQSQIARRLGCNSATVCRVLQRNGVPSRKVYRLLDFDEAPVVEMLRSGVGLVSTAKAFGLGSEAVRGVRDRYGIPPNPMGRRRKMA